MIRGKVYFLLCLSFVSISHGLSLPQPSTVQKTGMDRKFAEKPNTLKKVALDDFDDLNTNSIQEGSGAGFSWSNMITMFMQMLLGQNNGIVSPSKNEVDDTVQTSPWANLISMGLRVLSAFLGGPQQPEGIDKVDNQASSPLQGLLTAVLGAFLGQGRNPDQVAVIAGQASEFINIVMNLLDALKTSFSHRSLQARSLGKKDMLSEAAVASLTMLKGYVRSVKSANILGVAEGGYDNCAERALCEASAECAVDSQETSTIFCQLGSYATSYFLHKQSGRAFDILYEAGKRGRFGEDCRTIFLECNAV